MFDFQTHCIKTGLLPEDKFETLSTLACFLLKAMKKWQQKFLKQNTFVCILSQCSFLPAPTKLHLRKTLKTAPSRQSGQNGASWSQSLRQIWLQSRQCTGLTTFGQDCSLSKHWRDLSKSKFRTKQSQQVLSTNLSNVDYDETERFMPLQNLLGSNWLVLILPLGRLVKLTARLSLHLR